MVPKGRLKHKAIKHLYTSSLESYYFTITFFVTLFLSFLPNIAYFLCFFTLCNTKHPIKTALIHIVWHFYKIIYFFVKPIIVIISCLLAISLQFYTFFINFWCGGADFTFGRRRAHCFFAPWAPFDLWAPLTLLRQTALIPSLTYFCVY